MTRIAQYILLSVVAVLLSSCAKEESRESSIPPRMVDININILLENKFKNPYFSKNYYNNTAAAKFAGYGGVLAISNDDASWISAYDLCCPYEAPTINEVKVINLLQAQCPKCKSIYEVADGSGRVVSGPSTEHLRSYRVIREGNLFKIFN